MRARVEVGQVLFLDRPDIAHDAYVDADALPAGGEPEIEVEAVTAVTPAAAFALFRQRAATLVALVTTLGGPTEVIGSGITAAWIRAHVALPSHEGPPAAIVDLTGDPKNVAGALARLRDLGTLVVAGEARGRRLDLELYPDVHLRGLRIVGEPPDLREPSASDGEAIPTQELCTVEPSVPAPLGAGWYRVVKAS